MRQSTIAGIVVACGLLMALGLPTASLAQFPGPPEPRGPHWGGDRERGPERFIERHAEELGLSAETREAIEKIVEESRARSEGLREEAREEREELHELLNQAMPDEDEVMAQAEVVEALKLKTRQNRLKAMIAIRGLLTPEQREKLVEIREERSSRGKRGLRRHCRAEIEELCADAAPGKATLECLSGNWEELSDECRAPFEGGRRSGFGRRDRFGWRGF